MATAFETEAVGERASFIPDALLGFLILEECVGKRMGNTLVQLKYLVLMR